MLRRTDRLSNIYLVFSVIAIVISALTIVLVPHLFTVSKTHTAFEI
jgi:hypothetical protein